MPNVLESDLYGPVKRHLEILGYEVKAEIGAADVVAYRPDEEPLVVELKLGFSLTLLRQAVARQAVTDAVYVAVPRWKGRAGLRAFKGNVSLCRRLGLGVLSVRLRDGFVQVHADPAPYRPRKSKSRKVTLMREFARREGDPNLGGTRGTIVTAYRQDAMRCLGHLVSHGPTRGAAVAKATGVEKATRLMRDNHYGWFERISKGVYALSDAGLAAA